MASTNEKVDTKEESKKTNSEQTSNVKKPQKPKQAAKGNVKDAAKKGPGKKAIAAMQETLKKIKDEEDKVRQEEDEKIRKLEEAEEAKRLQVLREKERKDKKKQRDKERKEKLKAEGKFLSAKQKFDRARARTLLESLQSGVQILDISQQTKHVEKEDDESSGSDYEKNEADDSQRENSVHSRKVGISLVLA